MMSVMEVSGMVPATPSRSAQARVARTRDLVLVALECVAHVKTNSLPSVEVE